MSRVRLRWMFMINGKSLRERKREWDVCDFPKGWCQINHVLVTLLHGVLWNSLVSPLRWNNKSGWRSETLEMPHCYSAILTTLHFRRVLLNAIVSLTCIVWYRVSYNGRRTYSLWLLWACQQRLVVQRWENGNSRSDSTFTPSKTRMMDEGSIQWFRALHGASNRIHSSCHKCQLHVWKSSSCSSGHSATTQEWAKLAT